MAKLFDILEKFPFAKDEKKPTLIRKQDYSTALYPPNNAFTSDNTFTIVTTDTFMDVLIPAKESYCQALEAGLDFSASLEQMKEAANAGWLSTRDLIAKIGRASRLGERSRGVLDAGATSCNILLQTLASSIQEMLKKQ